MKISIKEETVDALGEYSRVPIAFCVKTRFRVELANNDFVLEQEPVKKPYTKDFDRDEKPTDWPKLWDISHWGVISAFNGDQRIGGIVIAYNTEGVVMLEGRNDLAVIWDIRVHPDFRGKGVGTQLFHNALLWSHKQGCRHCKVETQNINVPAYSFYTKQGFKLGTVIKHAYSEYPDEIQLNLYKEL